VLLGHGAMYRLPTGDMSLIILLYSQLRVLTIHKNSLYIKGFLQDWLKKGVKLVPKFVPSLRKRKKALDSTITF
jgi:hypothetical protein